MSQCQTVSTVSSRVFEVSLVPKCLRSEVSGSLQTWTIYVYSVPVVLFLVWNTFANTFWCMCSLHIICWSTSRKCNLLKPLLLLCHQTVVVIIRAHYYFHSPLAGALWIITYTYRLFIASVFTVGCKLFSSYKTVQMCCCVVLLCLSIVRKGEPFKKSWFSFVWNSQSTSACGISCTHDTTCALYVLL